jgi:adenylate cyclase
LVDARSSKHVWAEKYDRELKDVFAVTGEIILKIVEQLQVILRGDRVCSARDVPPNARGAVT